MNHDKIRTLTLAGLFAAMAFICFFYLRIEIPMGLGLTGKLYIGYAFVILASVLLGGTYGALSGAVGLTLADLLTGYVTSAPPTFVAKFILGGSITCIAFPILHLDRVHSLKKEVLYVIIAAIGGCIINVLTEPLIRYAFKYYFLGYAQEIAYVSAINCGISMAVNSVPSIVIAAILYRVMKPLVQK